MPRVPTIPARTPRARDPADDCVVRKLDEFWAELADSATPGAQRQLALKFLLHFVGDVHQPLHSADHNDAGGNRVPVLYPGIRVASNLHAYWDTRLVRLLGTDAHQVGVAIDQGISAADATAWASGTPGLWAIESNEQARNVAYQRADQAMATDSKGVQAVMLSASYDPRALPAVREQLARAGVRLAFALNEALR